MTEEQITKASNELKSAITQVLWSFSDKYLRNKENVPDGLAIMQSVLSESASEVEYQCGKVAPFTRHQADHICYQIGDWYFMMKPLLEGQHNLGYMKEKLKIMICGDE